MSEKSLREFADDIRQLINDGRAEEAIRGAQSLLRRFPRYLMAYCLLAEAALEQGITHEAGEIFRRVLSADPESFVAHAGLALVYADDGALDEALWHMTRAFELEPGMREIREQLRQFYQQRDGHAPGRLQLNRVALARTYLRDGWYDRAIQELSGELESEPERLDLRMALAEAQWHAGRRYEAVRDATRLLEELPFCLKANLLVGQFYADEGDLDRAAPFFRVVEEMDPEHEQALSLFGETSYLKRMTVTIPVIDEVAPGEPVREGQAGAPSWLADLPAFAAGSGDEELDWDAIIAHETDWRTRLGTATRAAIDDFRPNWRVELRRAVQRSLRERATAPPPKPGSPQGSALAPDRAAPRPAPRAASQHGPPQQAAMRALAAPSSNGRKREQAPASGQILEAIEEPQPALAWQEPLYHATHATLEARPGRRENRWEPPPPPSNGAKGRGPMETAPLWRPSLYFATLSALSQYDRMQKARTAAAQGASRPAGEAERKVPDRAWLEGLRHSTLTVLDEVAADGSNGAHSGNGHGWVAALREDSGDWLAVIGPAPILEEPVRSGLDEEPEVGPQTVEAGGVLELHADTEASLVARHAPEPELHEPNVEYEGPSLVLPDPIPPRRWVQELRAGTRASLLAVPERISVQWVRELREGTGAVLEERTQAESESKSVTERITGAASGVVQHAKEAVDTIADSSVAQRAKDIADTIRHKASDTLSSLLHQEEEPAPEEQADSASTLEPEAPALVMPEDDLTVARRAWESGQPKEAFAIYQRLFLEGGVPHQSLAEALSAWTSGGDAPGPAFQLLGDLYRRMGKMREAAACYREVINRM
jgi:tetratricopeptide (TPR) repeat protein